jgi:hypothetical protein
MASERQEGEKQGETRRGDGLGAQEWAGGWARWPGRWLAGKVPVR